jgi:hypothetical protein
MKVEILGGVGGSDDCPDGRTCPTFYKTDRGSYLVQGNLLSHEDLAGLLIPSGEGVLEVPLALVEVIRRADLG